MHGCMTEWKYINKISNYQWKYLRVSEWKWLSEHVILRESEYEDDLTSDDVNPPSSEVMWDVGWVGMFG